MNILQTLDRFLNVVSHDIIKNRIVYLEVDKFNYDLLVENINSFALLDSGIELKVDHRVADIGKSSILSYMGFKFVIVVNNELKQSQEDFYIAFKTDII